MQFRKGYDPPIEPPEQHRQVHVRPPEREGAGRAVAGVHFPLAVFTIEPHPDGPDSGLSLMQPDGSGYRVRRFAVGIVEATWICAQGTECHEIHQSPLDFLHNHPDVADIPGVGAALRCLAFPATAETMPASTEL